MTFGPTIAALASSSSPYRAACQCWRRPLRPMVASVSDIRQQLGEDMLLIRGPLGRTTLRLQNLRIPSQAMRLAWLTENLPKFVGSGVVYCLTAPDTLRVASWLSSHGIDAAAYHSGLDRRERERLEQSLVHNKLKVLVAIAALGVSFDKHDLTFVVHFQRPASIVAYYRQVARAGRTGDKAYGILLAGEEDEQIHNFFIDHAFPRPKDACRVLEKLAGTAGLTTEELLGRTRLRSNTLGLVLKTLESDGAIVADTSHGKPAFVLTTNPWRPDVDRTDEITRLRRKELEQMDGYIRERGCLMEFLTRDLGDPDARPCGVCANCQGRGLPSTAPAPMVADAVAYLMQQESVGEQYPRAKP